MSVYSQQLLPRFINLACGSSATQEIRAQLCSGLAGEVVEIGFGSGHNVAHYPDSVTRVAAVEPSDTAWKLGEDRVRRSRIPIERAGLDGQRLPFPDGSFDSAVSAWTLCTVPDDVAALRELRRVLRPGGTLHFAEHGLAPDESVRRWQYRLEPAWKRAAGGCHLTRPVEEHLLDAGFVLSGAERYYQTGVPRFSGAITTGVAIPGPGAVGRP